MGALMMAHMNAPIPAARELNDQVSPAMDRVLMRALAKEPEGRQGSMAEFGADLEQALADPYGMPEVEAPVVTEPPEGDSSGLDLTDSPTEPAPVVAETAQLAGTQVEQAPVQVVDTAPPEPVDPDSGSELPFWMRPSAGRKLAGGVSFASAMAQAHLHTRFLIGLDFLLLNGFLSGLD